jgi:macrolide transport system ATP-binding/permease protein
MIPVSLSRMSSPGSRSSTNRPPGPALKATLSGAFAALSLLLATVGLFGVRSCLVAQRTGAIGIRIALGTQVLRLMLVDGLQPAVIGLTLGLVLSAAITRELRIE